VFEEVEQSIQWLALLPRHCCFCWHLHHMLLLLVLLLLLLQAASLLTTWV
jgi:hypothetical protein